MVCSGFQVGNGIEALLKRVVGQGLAFGSQETSGRHWLTKTGLPEWIPTKLQF
jgi:hypothetical protein